MVPYPGPVIVGLSIHLPIFIGATIIPCSTVRSIKPYFKIITVLGQHFLQLEMKIFQIFLRTVIGMVPIPGRIINPHLQPVIVACLPQLPKDITFTIFPGTVFHRMLGIGGRPQYKTIMMRCRDNNSFHPGFFGDARPLHTVQIRWIKYSRIFSSRSPLHIGECIHAEMDKHVVFHFCPFQLTLRGQCPMGLQILSHTHQTHTGQNKENDNSFHSTYFNCNNTILYFVVEIVLSRRHSLLLLLLHFILRYSSQPSLFISRFSTTKTLSANP